MVTLVGAVAAGLAPRPTGLGAGPYTLTSLLCTEASADVYFRLCCGRLFSHSPTAALRSCATILDYLVASQLVSSFSVMWEYCGTLLSPHPGLEL